MCSNTSLSARGFVESAADGISYDESFSDAITAHGSDCFSSVIVSRLSDGWRGYATVDVCEKVQNIPQFSVISSFFLTFFPSCTVLTSPAILLVYASRNLNFGSTILTTAYDYSTLGTFLYGVCICCMQDQ